MSFSFGAASSQPFFGGASSAPAQSQPAFGAASSQSLFGAPSSSQSLFGAPSSQSLFGAPSSQSLFGAPSSQSLFGAPSSQSLFGNPSSQSLFGAPSSQSLFGAPSSQSLFGAPSSQSLFGAPSSQSLFGNPSSQSLFGAPSSQSLFGAPPSQPLFPAPQQQLPVQPTPPQLPRPLMHVIERLNPMHPESKFHAALYNVVPPSDVSRYTRPPTMDEKLWDQAISKNPDPSRMIPVQANNFDDLLTRSSIQQTRIQEHTTVLNRLEEQLGHLSDTLDTDLTTRLAACRRRHREQARRLLRIAAAVQVAASKGDPMSVSEAERKKKLDAIAKALAAPAEFKDKLSDLVELAEVCVLQRGGGVEIREGRADVIRDILMNQLKGIEHLELVCEKSERDIAIMAEGLAER